MATKQSHIQVNGVDICVHEAGAGDPAVVFLHFWGGSGKVWSETIDHLSETHRCIALDFRGWGQSSKGGLDYSLDALAADVLALVAHLSLTNFILVGHSMGGKVAQIIAAQRPAGLKGLVLVAPAPPTPLPTPQAMRDHFLSCLDSREGVQSVIPMLAAKPLTEAHHELMIENSLAGDPGAKRAWCDTGMDYDATGKASQVDVPIRVVVGGSDNVETETSLRAAFDEHYPGTDYHLLDDVGHLAPLEAPADVAHAIRTARTN